MKVYLIFEDTDDGTGCTIYVASDPEMIADGKVTHSAYYAIKALVAADNTAAKKFYQKLVGRPYEEEIS